MSYTCAAICVCVIHVPYNCGGARGVVNAPCVEHKSKMSFVLINPDLITFDIFCDEVDNLCGVVDNFCNEIEIIIMYKWRVFKVITDMSIARCALC